MIKSIEDEFAGFEVVKPAPATAKPPAGFEGFEVVSRPPAQPATAIQTPSQDEFAGFELVQPAPAQRQIMSPYLRGVSEGTIKDEAAQDERRGDLLGYAPELALAMTTQVADFPLGLVRGLRDTTRSLLSIAIGEKNTENMVKAIYKIPILGKIWEEESKFVDKFGQINQDAQALLRREAIERGGLPGAVAAELTQTVQNTLLFLKTVKALGVGYGGQQGIKSTLQSAAVRSAFAAITAEDLSPKERLAALGWSMAYQSTPALSSTIGKWAQSDWIAKAADIAANAGISGLQVQRVIGDAHARAEAEGKPNLGGFYSTLELIKMFGSDAVFGMMTTAFREQGKTKAEKATERLASEIKKSVEQYEQAKAQQPTAPVEDAGKPITPPPAPNQTPDKAATPLTTEGEAGVVQKETLTTGEKPPELMTELQFDNSGRASVDGAEVTITRIGAKEAHVKELRSWKQGAGVTMMRQLIKWADANGVRLFGEARPMTPSEGVSGLDPERLLSFYKRFGFKPYGLDSVARDPVNATQQAATREGDRYVFKADAPAKPPTQSESEKPTEQSFNSLMDTLKKSRDAEGTRISEGEIRTALESDSSTGNKGRFKDMTPTEQAAAMGIMQRMAGERGVGPGAADIDDPAFQPRMTIMKDGERVEPDTGVTGLRNSQIERERAVYGLAPAMDKIRLSDPQAWDDAMRILNENPYRGIELTNELTTNRRAVDKTELAILLRHKVEVNLEHNKAAAATLKAAASGDPAAIRDANLRHEQAVQMHQQIADVIGRAATTSGQALQAYKMFSDEEFNLATMELKLKAAKGKDSISPEERAALKELTEKHKAALEKLTKRIAELEKQAQDKADDDNAKSEIEKTAREKSKREREGGKEPDLEGDREKALNTIRNKAEKGDVESLADLKDPLQKLALYFEQKDIDANNGKSTLSYEKLVELVHNEVKDIIPEAALNDVRDAISGYGQVRFPSAEPAKVALRRHKAEMLKAAPLETLQANIAKLKADGAAAAKELESTKHTGYQRDKIEARARELTRQLQSAMKEQDRLMKELGIETGDPAQRLRTALDAKKTRLQNQIDDINRAITQHKELVRNKGVPVEDDITRQLTMMRDERMAAYKEMFPDKPMSMEERIERATKAAEKRLAEWEERAALARQGIFKTDDPIEQMPETERLSLLRRETEALKAEIKSWRDLAFPKSTPEERRLKSWKTRTQKTIHEIERRIDQQDYSKRAKPEPVVLDQEGFAMKKALDEVRSKWNSMLEKERLKNRTWTQKLWDRSTEPFNFARTVMASYDLSATGRQGWMLVLGHPKTAIGAFKAQINALRSEHKAYQIEQAIVNDKNYAKMLKAKVEFTEFSGKPSKMEESFMSRFASRIPGIQASQRAYTTFLNKMRADVFNTLYRSLAKAGEPTDAELLAIGRYINMATGRGDLGKHALASQSLATIFWAPRLFLSRFQLLAGAPMYHGSARTRKLIAGEYARFLGGMAMVYALAELSGAEIEEDPRSGQFGKIRYGNTRIDPLAGLAQATTLIARIATGETKTAKGEIVALRGEKKPFTRSTVDYISQFLRSKLSPLIGTAVDIAAGETIVGEPVTPTSIVKRSVVPLAFQDIYDAMIDQGIPKGTAISMLAFLGFGVQTYETAQSKKSDTAIDNKFLLQALEDQRRRLKRAKEQSAP